MWDFIWHLRGSIPLEGAASNVTVLDRVENLLRQQQKQITQRSAESISFKLQPWNSGITWSSSWLAMLIYDQGDFRIEQGTKGRRLRYDLRSLYCFLFCVFAALLFFLFARATGGGGLAHAVFELSWLYGINILMAWLRVPKAIRNAVGN